jgi:hypothetical protein
MPRVYKPKTDRKNGKHKPSAVPPEYAPGFIAKLDGRTEVAHVLKQRFDCIASDLGGEAELSHFQRSLVERAVFLEAVLQDMEHTLATASKATNGDKAAAKATSADLIGKWVQATNAYVGLCARLGLKRQKRTVDLRTYIADGAGGVEEGK